MSHKGLFDRISAKESDDRLGKASFARFRHTDTCSHTRLRLFAVDDLSQAVGKVRVSESGSDHR